MVKDQPVSSEDERIVSVNPSPAAVITGPSSDATEQPKSSDVGGERSTPIHLICMHLKNRAFHMAVSLLTPFLLSLV
ncbi:uncharacterized protein Pyn_40102 [Prunus yedoensis var. nudiflora]|uniref:Uncharacterized protein n=1 Tax=Prunus yedoensis var. nudiflora TaxID=2094558 RepID=A0A314YZI5_PRUYE|nr:uncharacterized protein Pyn_40102 [Prunus yedoensis var. nudiflora]